MKLFFVIGACVLGVGCGGAAPAPATSAPAGPAPAAHASAPAGPITRAAAELLPTAQSKVRGMATLHMDGHALLIVAKIENLAPGSYGFAFHEGNNCLPPDAKSAGAMIGPDKDGKPRGFITDVKSDGQKRVTVKITVPSFDLDGADGVLGHALVLHAWPYDPKVDIAKVPFLACGVVSPRAE